MFVKLCKKTENRTEANNGLGAEKSESRWKI